MTKEERLYSICKVLYFLLPFPVCWLALVLTSRYWKFYDIGVNMTANNGYLIVIVMPILLTALYGVAVGCLTLANRFIRNRWHGLLLSSLLVLAVGLGYFAQEVWSSRDYGTEEPQKLTVRITDFLLDLMAEITEKP